MLLIELFVVLLKLDPSIAESIDMENVSIVSVDANEIGEFDTGNDMLRSNLQVEIIRQNLRMKTISYKMDINLVSFSCCSRIIFPLREPVLISILIPLSTDGRFVSLGAGGL